MKVAILGTRGIPASYPGFETGVVPYGAEAAVDTTPQTSERATRMASR
jgi:hypothetical protein